MILIDPTHNWKQFFRAETLSVGISVSNYNISNTNSRPIDLQLSYSDDHQEHFHPNSLTPSTYLLVWWLSTLPHCGLLSLGKNGHFITTHYSMQIYYTVKSHNCFIPFCPTDNIPDVRPSTGAWTTGCLFVQRIERQHHFIGWLKRTYSIDTNDISTNSATV